MFAQINPRKIYKKCVFCGEQFECVRCDAQTCGSKCRGKLARWRKKLPKNVDKARSHIKEIATYLDYDLSKPATVQYMKSLMSEIRAEMERHGVRFIG